MPAENSVFPSSLLTATPAEGHALARQLADQLLDSRLQSLGMPELLRPGAVRPSPEIVAAIYFHAIAVANAGWSNPAPRR